MACPTTKDRIIAAAMDITQAKGARHLTIDAVTLKSGLSKGGVLYHFPTKTALLEGLISQTVQHSRTQIETYRSAIADAPNPTLRAFVQWLVAILDQKQSLPTALLAASAENPELLEPVREKFADLWQRIRDEATDLPTVQVIWCALNGVHYLEMFQLAPDGTAQLRNCLTQIATMISNLPQTPPQNPPQEAPSDAV